MTYQSPRIYLYKITFEEVPYYYYGVHKEKKFDEYYMGSPKTNKWCWELYTPKKQILQFFDFTDEGWIEAQKVETRLIRPFYNTDKWCLNENCGGYFSLNTLSIGGNKGGQRAKELGVGFFAMSEEEKYQARSKGAKRGIGGKKTKELGVGVCGLTQEQRINAGRKGGEISVELKLGIHGRSPEKMIEDSREAGKKGGNKAKELGLGICGLTPEQRRVIVKKTNCQKWKCCETGYVSTAAGVVAYQRARGIDTSKRKRIA
jgi:hypothetical protein